MAVVSHVSEGKQETDYHELLPPSTRCHRSTAMTLASDSCFFSGTRTDTPSPAIPQVPSASLTDRHRRHRPLTSSRAGPAQLPPQQPNQPNSYTYQKARPHRRRAHHDANRFLSFLWLSLPPCLTQNAATLDAAEAHSSFAVVSQNSPLVPCQKNRYMEREIETERRGWQK